MLFTLSYTSLTATDLGYLLHKNPERIHRVKLAFGTATVFFPEASPHRCTAALHLQIDPIGLIRGRRPSDVSFVLQQYVNDRPYAATSFLSVAISKAFGTAMSGRSKERPELAEKPLPLTATIAALPSRGGPAILQRAFEPLGYTIEATRHPLDESFPTWGESPYYTVQLEATVRLRDLLSHLYVLIPVLDNEKHYWVGEPEVENLLRHGERWLGDHPDRELIAQRYLKHRRSLVDSALSRLMDEEPSDPDEVQEARDKEEESVEKPLRLNEARLKAIQDALKQAGAKRVLDLGCGEGKLLSRLLKDRNFEEIVGVDVSHRSLEIAQKRLHWDRLPEAQRSRIRLLHGSLTYRDRRLEGYDAAAVVEVIEHLDLPRLRPFERVIFEHARPRTLIVTTPNSEYNVRFEELPAGRFRHRDHRFEWTRNEFRAWATGVAERHGYSVEFAPIGPEDPELGPPTQMGVFSR